MKTIDVLPKSYQKIQELFLNHNLIDSLSGLEQFINLRVFHIKFNFIQNLTEFLRIPNKNLLISLNFIGNPAENQLSDYPNFLNNFINLRSFNSSKESSFTVDSSSVPVSSGKICKKLHFIDDFREKDTNEINEGLMTGNFNTKKNSEKIENDENCQNWKNEENCENSAKTSKSGQEICEKAKKDVSFSSENNEDAFDAHISHIDNDICRLSVIFYEKLLKEKALLGLKRYYLQCYYRENKFCQEFYEKRLKNRGFWVWRKKFVEKLLFRSFSKNLSEISEKINQKTTDFAKELSVSALNLRVKKQYNLRKITETDQDYIDSNREKEKPVDDCKVLRENTVINNEQKNEKTFKKIGFDEYKEISMKNGKNEKVTEENYRHDLPLSTSFSSKCPYGSV